MSMLLGIILSHDEQASLDVRQHWPLHAALRELHGLLAADSDLSDRWNAAGLPKLRLQPDSEVGMRTSGVTAALWRLAESGALVLSEDGGGVRFKPDRDYYAQGRRHLMRLDPLVAGAVQRAGQRFAANLAASSK
jgi:hypothetical protein